MVFQYKMIKSKFTEQAQFIQQEREMESLLSRLLDDDSIELDVAREIFLEQFEGEEYFFNDFVDNYYR